MRERHIAILVLLMLCSCGSRNGKMIAENISALENSIDMDSESIGENNSSLEFAFREVEFEEMKIGDKKDTVFYFANNSEKAVVIRNVAVSCGCTHVKWSESPVLPGGKGKIEVGFTAEKEGIFFKKIVIFVNGTSKPVTLAIKGCVAEK